MKKKHIAVNPETYDALLNLGTMRDTFDTLINRLIRDAQKWQKVENKFLKDLPPMAQKSQDYKFILQWFKNKGLLE